MASHDWSREQRQPLLALAVVGVSVFRKVIQFLFPLLILVFFRDKQKRFVSPELVTAAIILATLVFTFLEYYFFRFQIAGEELIIRRGFFSRKHLIIPLTRIQAVNISQSWIHQLLGLAKVEFDSAGSQQAEASIVIQGGLAQELKKYIVDRRTPEESGKQAAAEAQADPPVFRLNTSDVLKLAFSANHLKAFFILLAFALRLADDLMDIAGYKRADAESQVMSFLTQTDLSLLFLALGISFLLAMIYSFLRVALTYFNFELRQSFKGFNIKTGMFNTQQQLAPYGKIQYLSWQANWLRSKLPLYMLRMHLAGMQQKSKAINLAVPLPRMEVLNAILPAYATIPGEELQVRVSPVMIWRYVFRGLFLAAVVGLLSFFWLKLFLFVAPLILLFYGLSGWLFVRKFRIYANEESLAIRSGTFGHSFSLMKWYKIQSVSIRQTILQKKSGLAGLHIYTASGKWVIPAIPLPQARALQNIALYKIEFSAESWMR